MPTSDQPRHRRRSTFPRVTRPDKLLDLLKEEVGRPMLRRTRIRGLFARLFKNQRFKKLGYKSLPSLLHSEFGTECSTINFECYAAIVEITLADVKVGDFKTGTLRPLFPLKDKPDHLQAAFNHAVKIAGGRENLTSGKFEVATAFIQGNSAACVVAHDAATATKVIASIIDALDDNEAAHVVADVIMNQVLGWGGATSFQQALRQRVVEAFPG